MRGDGATGLVYGGLDGLDVQWIEKTNASLPQPDVWIYLDIPIEESFKRRPERRDRYESDRAYLEKVREGYLKLFEEKHHLGHSCPCGGEGFANHKCPGCGSCGRWYVVDGMGSIEEVHQRIMAVLG